MRVLRTTDTLIEAEMLKARIEETGIICFIENEHSSNILPIQYYKNGSVRIYVADDDFDSAIQLLNEIESGSIAIGEDFKE